MKNLPQVSEIIGPLEELIRREGEIYPKDAYQYLSNFFKLSSEQISQNRSDGRNGSAFENNVQWAREELAKRGVIDRKFRGRWVLTKTPEVTLEMLIDVMTDGID